MARKALWGTVAGGMAGVAVAGAIAMAVPAVAETGGQAMAAGQSVAVAAAPADTTTACDRLKKHDERRQAVLTRLQADANTKGSIAWLTAKAATAAKAGDTARAQLYTDKAALRSALVEPLKKVETDLAAVIKANCG